MTRQFTPRMRQLVDLLERLPDGATVATITGAMRAAGNRTVTSVDVSADLRDLELMGEAHAGPWGRKGNRQCERNWYAGPKSRPAAALEGSTS